MQETELLEFKFKDMRINVQQTLIKFYFEHNKISIFSQNEQIFLLF